MSPRPWERVSHPHWEPRQTPIALTCSGKESQPRWKQKPSRAEQQVLSGSLAPCSTVWQRGDWLATSPGSPRLAAAGGGLCALHSLLLFRTPLSAYPTNCWLPTELLTACWQALVSLWIQNPWAAKGKPLWLPPPGSLMAWLQFLGNRLNS